MLKRRLRCAMHSGPRRFLRTVNEWTVGSTLLGADLVSLPLLSPERRGER